MSPRSTPTAPLRFPDGSAPRVAILGAGASGLCMGAQLLRAGVSDFTIFEKSDGVGGTWHDNSYPGSGCDVPSHLYCFSFAHETGWSRRFAGQAEILAYLERFADRFGLRPHIRFGCEVESCRFDAEQGLWRIRTTAGEEHTAHVLVSATGQLNRPYVPKIDGLEHFQGHSFHSARWDHAHDLAGERIAVIGNGASAVQFVPQIAPEAERLLVFQRSANWIVPKPDAPYDERALRRFSHPLFAWLYRALIYWSLEIRFFAFRKPKGLVARGLGRVAQAHLEAQVHDPALRAALTPDYPVGCKRVLISDDYYPTLERPNVELVTSPIVRVTKDAVVTEDGREHPVDTIVFGTGFETTHFLAPIRIEGRDGALLEDRWREGAEAHLGMAVAGFPNFFMLYGPNTNLGHNSILFMVECQVRYVLQCLRRIAREGLRSLEVRSDVEERYNEAVQRSADASVWGAGCSSWYKTASGRITNNWPDFTVRYWWRTRHPDERDYRAVPAR